MDRGSSSTGRWEYIDFELEIREGSRRRYPVSVRSPAGEAQEQMRFPFDEWELENRLLALENTLLRSGGARRRIPSEEEQPIQEFGQSLLEALLVGEVRTRYAMSLLEARRQNKGLRLKLRVHPPELARLPWEFLYDPDRDEYLSLSDKTPIVRYLDLRQPVERLPVSPPLRILGVVASPSDLPELDVEHEKRLVEQAIRILRTNGLVELTWLEGQTWGDLQEVMWGGPWHVFHFIGHGVFDEASDEGCIALSDEAGRKRLLGARNLARLLDGHYSLRLAFLNSCEGAKGSARDAFSGAAATLVRRGVPAVVAMQYEVSDEAAIAFARTFYRAVANGLPVDAAVAAGRTAVSMDSALEWGTPVLYMRSPDGRIFDISTGTPPIELRRYREGVESVWADEELNKREVEWLRDLANSELGLSPSTAAEIEREVMGDTKEAILERQEQAAREQKAEEERRKRLDELYARARRSHRDREWQAVVDLFDQIHALDPTYPDVEGLLTSAREELAKPPTAEVPDLSGQSASQASSTLENRGLKLGARDEAPSETVPEGSIIRQTPTAETEVKPGSSVSVTLSSGQEKKATPTSPYVEPERQDRWKREEVLSTVTSTLAMFGGIVAIVAALIGGFTHLGDLGAFSGPPGVLLGEFAGYCLALVGILGGLVGLHIRQAPTYGRLGKAGFLTALVGTTLILVATFIWLMFLYFYRNDLSLLVSQDPPVWLILLSILGELGVFVGYILLGGATLQARVLPRWCGVGFIIASLSVALDVVSGEMLLLIQTIVVGLLWLALGYLLWSQRDVPAGQSPPVT